MRLGRLSFRGGLLGSLRVKDSARQEAGTLTRSQIRVDDGAGLPGPKGFGGPGPGGAPVIGFMLVGGTLVGAQVRDIRLANELA
ncbi:MAG: hypothetical protein ACKO3P_17815, partial [Planctomycetaceae bacterium]